MEKRRMRRRIVHDIPPIGARLKGSYKGRDEYANVVEHAGTKSGIGILYKGKLYSSMTAAAMAATGQSTNGWKFWRVV